MKIIIIIVVGLVVACAPGPRSQCHVTGSETVVVPVVNDTAECAGDWFAVGIDLGSAPSLRCSRLNVTCWIEPKNE